MAGGNLAGRLGWAAVSDRIGRRATFKCLTFGAVPIFAALPYCIEQVVMDPTGPMAPVYLGVFCASTVASISIMGGTFAVLPPYEAGMHYAGFEFHENTSFGFLSAMQITPNSAYRVNHSKSDIWFLSR